MYSQKDISYIDEVQIYHKRVLLRVDFNVSVTPSLTIADDARIKQALPTINYLLKNANRLILVSHFDRPARREKKYSLKIVSDHLQTLLSKYKVILVDDFTSKEGNSRLSAQKDDEILLLENIRFYPEEQKEDKEFAKKLSKLADVYVNDAFGVSHRADASVVGVSKFVPSCGGLLLKKEVETISRLLQNPQKPFVAIIGGAKISTKIDLLYKLVEIADFLLLGGGVANTFLRAFGIEIGKSLFEGDEIKNIKKIIEHAKQKNTQIILPEDVVVGDSFDNENGGQVVKVENVAHDLSILDIGPETQAKFGSIINDAKTIVWNGPVGFSENEQYRRGTDFLYYSIAQNRDALSIVGGGDTLAAISKKEYLEKITHISTGGGAMLEFIEKGTLPGIEALKKAPRTYFKTLTK